MKTYRVTIESIAECWTVNACLGDTVILRNKGDYDHPPISIELLYRPFLWFRIFTGLRIVLNPFKFQKEIKYDRNYITKPITEVCLSR